MDVCRRSSFIILSIVLLSSISEGKTVSKTRKKNGSLEGQRKKTLRVEDPCSNRNPECERNELYCFRDSDFMSQNCKLTCKMCARGIHLMDRSSKCAVMLEKRKESHCIKEEWLETCPYSCRAYVCQDRNSERCKRSTFSDCLQNHTYMTKNCKLTCQMCTPGNPLMDTSSKCAAEMRENRERLCTQWDWNNRCPYTCQGIPVASATSPENMQESKLYPQGQQLPYPQPQNPVPQPPQPSRVIQPQPQILPSQQTVQQPPPIQQPQLQLPQPGAVPLRAKPQPVQPGAVMQPIQPQPQLGVVQPQQPLQPQSQPQPQPLPQPQPQPLPQPQPQPLPQPQLQAASVQASPPQLPSQTQPQIQPPQLQPMAPVPGQRPQPAVIGFQQQLPSPGLIPYPPYQTQTTGTTQLWQSPGPGYVRQAQKHRGEKELQKLAISTISHKTKLTMRKEKDSTKNRSRNISNNDTRKRRKKTTKTTSKPKISKVSTVMENQANIARQGHMAKDRQVTRVLGHRNDNNKGITNQSRK